MRIFRAPAAILVLLFGITTNVLEVSASQESSTYVGSSQYKKCHQKLHKEWKQTLHSQIATDVKLQVYTISD